MTKQFQMLAIVKELGYACSLRIQEVAVAREIVAVGEDAPAFLKLLTDKRLVSRVKTVSSISGRRIWHYWPAS